MRKAVLATILIVSIVMLISPLAGKGHLKARLNGYQEVPPVSTPAYGQFIAKVDWEAGILAYVLEYKGLDMVKASHIHFGQPGVEGGVIAWLCVGNSATAPISVPICTDEGPVEGEISFQDIVGPEEQGIGAGDIRSALRAILSGMTYVNVHSEAFPEGEIRGQIRRGFGRGQLGHKDRDVDRDKGEDEEDEKGN